MRMKGLRLLLAGLLLWQAVGAALAREVPDTMAQRALACTGCHGPQGRSSPEGYVPRLAGKPAGYLLAFNAGYGGPGIWAGLALGLAGAAIMMNWRFARRQSLGLVPQIS